MWTFAIAALLSIVLAGSASAEVTSVTCSGKRLYDPDTAEVAFKFDGAGKVKSVGLMGVTKLTTTQADEKHIAFEADTATVRYTLSFNRKTREDAVFSTVEIDGDGRAKKETSKVFIAKCASGS